MKYLLYTCIATNVSTNSCVEETPIVMSLGIIDSSIHSNIIPMYFFKKIYQIFAFYTSLFFSLLQFLCYHLFFASFPILLLSYLISHVLLFLLSQIPQFSILHTNSLLLIISLYFLFVISSLYIYIYIYIYIYTLLF